ncbi:hypothetical protein [Palaeococcus sp. (in: euryarchaeotes)]
MRWKAAVLILLFLASALPAYSFQFSKVIDGKLEGNRTFKIHVAVPPEYRIEWIRLLFNSSERCNASAFYRVVQYGEAVKEGNTSVRWSSGYGGKHVGEFVIPMRGIRDEFDVYVNVSFPCAAEPLIYMAYLTIDFGRLTHLEVKTNRSVDPQWGDIRSPAGAEFNISGKLLGIEAELYGYRGKQVHATLNWEDHGRNFTLESVNDRLWIPGENGTGKVKLTLDLPPGVFASATAYYLVQRKPVNEDLLIKRNGTVHFIYPLEGMMWDEGTLDVWFRLNSEDTEILAFDFGGEKVSKLYTKGDKFCVLVYPPYGWRTKKCVLIPERRIHRLQLSMNRNPDGTRHLYIELDDMRILKKEVNSGMRLWYLGDKGVDVLSFEANLRRNPNYYVVPPDYTRTNISLGASLLALVLSLICVLREGKNRRREGK